MTAAPAVLLVGDSLNVGGTEGQFVELACGLRRSGWNVRVACLRATGPLRGRLDAAGIPAWSYGRGSLRSIELLRTIGRVARFMRAHRIDIVHCFDFYSNAVGVPAGRLTRRPVVIASQRDLGNLRSPFEQKVQRAMLGLAHHVVVNSPAVAARVRAHGNIAAGRLTLLRNGVDLARFSAGPAPGARPTMTIGALANLRPEKGLESLVRAAATVRLRYPDTRFAIWGEGPQRPVLEQLIDRLGLAGALELKGRTEAPEAALHALDVLVMPSLSEASSNALIEAMAAGRAIVATRVGGNPDLVEDEVSGLLVPPDDPDALAKALLRLIERPALAGELAARARERAVAEFDLERMIGRFETFYRQALELAGR
jgi:glycosyltransferase involved in cell wall biosynthesis